MKMCNTCGGMLPLDAFSLKSGCRGGRAHMCKRCHASAQLARYYRDHDTSKRSAARRRAERTDEERARDNAVIREWHEKHKDIVSQNKKKYYAAHRDKIIERSVRWQKANPERSRERCRKYARSEKGLLAKRLRQQRRRAWRSGGNVTRHEWLEQLNVFGHRCAYCLLALESVEMEHVIPLSRGGLHSIDNVVPSCPPCNAKKRDRGPLSMVGAL